MLQGDGGEGLETGFCWWFNQETSEVNKDSGDEQAVVRPAVSDLKVSVSGAQLAAGEDICAGVELDNAVVVNRTTAEWTINVPLPTTGCYNVTVKAFKPITCTSFQTHILVQDPVGELPLNTSSVTATHQKLALFFSIAAGTNMSVSLLVNTVLQYKNCSYATGEESAVVLLFNHTGTFAVELRAENRVSSQNKSVRVCVEGNRKPSPQVKVNPNWQPASSPVDNLADTVRIYAAKRAYPTNTDIILVVVADVPDPVEFIWHFGDSTSAKTTSRTISKRYSKPGRFDVVVVMSSGQTSVASKVLPLEVQRAVKLNRLVHQASVLQKQTVTVSCRVNVGTNLTFLWSFGDGSSSLGQSTEQYVYHSTGEFRIEVTVSNLVSSASLSSHIFVVDRPCQPPPVKNMGPLELQVWRYESVRLGVTYENDMNCDTAAGLHYSWALLDSVGQIFPLPRTDTHRQSLILPSHLLHYETYTAMARVQVIGSVVYSNYSVKVKVMPSPPVAFIQGGTNIFINNRNTTLVVLDGQRSYDPDFPLNPLSYSWTCKPVSSVTSSCFNQHIPSSSPVLTFPVGFLKPNFDQFQVTLTIHSRGHSASSETFITITPNVLGKVSLYCPQCSGDQVNWDQPFSVTAKCEDCGVSSDMIQYSWRLYLVNASSKPVTEVPFCHKVDLSAPSTVIKGPATSTETPPAIDTADYTHDSVPVFLTEHTSKTRTKKQNVDLSDSRTTSKKRGNMSNTAGEEILYRPLGEFDPAEYHPSAEYPPLALENSGGLYSDHLGNVFSEFPNDPDSSADWEFSLPVLETGDVGGRLDPDYDVSLTSADEGDPGISAGRPTGVDGETFSLGEDSVFGSTVHEDEGSNLVDPRPSAGIQEQTLLDLPRDPVDRRLFQSYTFTGTSSSLLSFRPFSLMPGSRYMLEVTASEKSKDGLLGRTQLFFKTQPAPKGVTCQVQPVKGMELHTHFSIFCTSGKEDLMYEYSFSVGGRTPRMMYQGRDFQYYFRLPSGDPSDDYKVTIYIEIRSTYGTATKPCPVTVQVHPSFVRDSSSSRHDPDLELTESGLRNLSALVQLGNSVEIRNYISLLGSILNRLSQDTEANTLTQTRLRTVLICTVCELESSEQQSMEDNLCVLKDILQSARQVSLVGARRVIVHIQAISDQFLESSSPVQYSLDSKTLNTLITVLSHTLQAAAFSPESSLITQALESDSPNGENMTTTVAAPRGCTSESQTGVHIGRGGLTSAKQLAQLIADVHQTASDLMLKYILSHEAREHNISAGLITLYATYLNSTVISSGSTTFHIPVSLMQHLFVCVSGECKNEQRRPCVLSVLTELAHSPYTWVPYTTKLNGPVVDLNLYKCSTRRKIHIHSFVQPINIELQLPQRNERSVREYVLLHNQVNYHSFNITQEHLQQAIQLSVTFKPLSSKVFPIMLLFRMFDRPTSSMHHLHRIHRWESNTTCITLPPSYLNTAGVGHLALLNAGKAPRHKHLSEQIRYSLTVASSLCLSWDSHQGAWTHQGCRTQQTDTDTVNCSCYQLRPLTVVQQQLEGSHDSADLGSFLSVSRDLTVPGVLVLCLCLYILGRVLCKKADMVFKQNHRVHYLPDNSASDPYFYVATIHTGICSAACMSAKVYIVLYGEDGTSQTRELQVPGCTLFRRNSQDTFIISTEDSLGLVWGVHIWHDNSGPSPQWYLKQVEVSEVNRDYVKGRAWLFVGQCWLAVSKGDGKVERMLRVCTQGIGFAKMLSLKLSDYLADYHIWISVLICPSPNAFTHSQRLTVCLLLLLGYTCVNTVMISQMDEQLPLELGIIDISATSVTTGILSALAVLPAATVISCLFRWRKVKIMGSGVQHAKGRKIQKDDFEDGISVNDSTSEPHLSWTGLQQQTQAAWSKKHQGRDLPSMSTMILKNKDTHEERAVQSDVIVRKEDALTCGSSVVPEDKEFDQSPRGNEFDYLSKSRIQQDLLSIIRDGNKVIPLEKCSSHCGFEKLWPGHSSGSYILNKLRGTSHYLAWALCLLLSLCCLILSTVLGMRFRSSQVLLWIHSLFFSLMSCIFFIQPVMILTVAVLVSLWYRKRSDFHSFFSVTEFEIKDHNGAIHPKEHFTSSVFPLERPSCLEELLRARRRTRYLRLVRPPTELRKTRGKKRREAHLWNNLRDFSVCVFMLFLVLCTSYGSSFHDQYHLNTFVKKLFTRDHDNAFMSIQKHEDWWKWTQTSLPNLLYKNVSIKTESHILIGEPILRKMEAPRTFQCWASVVTTVPECLPLFLMGSRSLSYPHSSVKIPVTKSPSTCGRLGCYSGPSATVVLGHTKSDAVSRLKHLHSSGWLGGETVAISVHFTLYSPAPNLFTSVTLLTEQSPTGVLLPSSKVQSVRVYRTPAVWDYVVMICQLLFLLFSLLQLCLQVSTIGQQGLMGYCRTPYNWLELILLTVTFVYYVYYVYHSVLTMELVEQLQTHNYRGHADVNLLATWEQHIRTLCGVTLFLLTTKCVTLLRANRTLAPSATLLIRSLVSLFRPVISGLILLVALSCVGNLLFVQNWAFSSLPRSLQTVFCYYRGHRADRGLHLSGHYFLSDGVLCLSSTVVWIAVVMAVVSTTVRSTRSSRSRRTVFTVAELASCVRQKMSELTLQRRQTLNDNYMERRTYYLEEFELLVDELLFRLDALSNSLHHTLPSKAHCYVEESPVISPVQESSHVDTQDFVKIQMIEDTLMNDHTDGHGENLPASPLLRFKLEQKILQLLQQRSQSRKKPSQTVWTSNYLQQLGKKAEENPNDRELQTYLRGQSCLVLPASDSLIRVWTEDVLEKQADQWTKTKNYCCLKPQATHTEVVVEALVHEEPESEERGQKA
uniref:Polycystic kidney disease 1b n=2 Tax=Anabas testudineus TaxID=64144 RepID=A0AAQ6IQD0_ANATE